MKKLGMGILVIALLAWMPVLPVGAVTNDYDNDDLYGGYADWDTEGSYFMEDQRNVTGKTIAWDAGTVGLKVGEKVDLLSTMIFSNEEYEITPSSQKQWSSNNAKIADVTSGGVVTANKVGFAKISVTYYDNRSNKITQTMKIHVTAANTTQASYYFVVREGKSLDLKVLLFPQNSGKSYDGTVSWASDHPGILSVTDSGVAVAERFGTGKITATYTDAAGNVSARKVTVKASSNPDPFAASTITLSTGDSVDLVKMLYPGYTNAGTFGTVSCTTSDADVLSVDSGNVITAKAAGSCDISVSLKESNNNNAVTESIQIKVQVN